jgi:hypothetical protein
MAQVGGLLMPAHARPDLTRDRIEPMVKAGLCVAAIARACSSSERPCHESQILRRLRKWKLTAARGRIDRRPGDLELIVSLCNGQRRLREVSAMFRDATGRTVSVHVLKRLSRFHGLNTRPAGGSPVLGVRGLTASTGSGAPDVMVLAEVLALDPAVQLLEHGRAA